MVSCLKTEGKVKADELGKILITLKSLSPTFEGTVDSNFIVVNVHVFTVVEPLNGDISVLSVSCCKLKEIMETLTNNVSSSLSTG